MKCPKCGKSGKYKKGATFLKYHCLEEEVPCLTFYCAPCGIGHNTSDPDLELFYREVMARLRLKKRCQNVHRMQTYTGTFRDPRFDYDGIDNRYLMMIAVDEVPPIKALREARGLTLPQLSTESGFSIGLLTRFESDEKEPAPLHLSVLAKILNVYPDDLT